MPPSEPQDSRIASLDALRGFDMCWILGLESVFKSLLNSLFPESSLAHFFASQLSHVDWEGFHFYDLIFPLFLFLSGVSMAIALPRRLQREGLRSAVIHLLQRGLIFSGGLKDGWEKVRWLGVLQRIGIASAAAGLLSLFLSSRALVLLSISILAGYAALFALSTNLENGGNIFREGHNIVNSFDAAWLPGRKHSGTHDPEGLLSTIPAVVTALLGLLTGRWLRSVRPPTEILRGLFAAGGVLILAGWAWHPFFPIIKKLWTSSFVLVAGGWSLIFLSLFYWAVDIRGWSRWTPMFLWVGSNPILLYLLSGMGLFRTAAERLAGKGLTPVPWVFPSAALAIMLLFARWLYQRRIFVKV
jgi:predicted acyltransferase